MDRCQIDVSVVELQRFDDGLNSIISHSMPLGLVGNVCIEHFLLRIATALDPIIAAEFNGIEFSRQVLPSSLDGTHYL